MAIRSPQQIRALVQKSLVNSFDIIDIPPALMRIKGIQAFSVGNFSVIQGKPKTRKSFFIQYLLSQCLNNDNEDFAITQHGRKGILCFDTEQSREDVQSAVIRVLRMAGKHADEECITCHSLREYSIEERLDVIEHVLSESLNTSLAVLDGVKDLVRSINDEGEANDIIGRVMKWSTVYNIHIILVIHQNKGDENARGHIGTESQNKAETVLQVTKADEHNETKTTVTCKFARKKAFPSFSFNVEGEQDQEIVTQPVFKEQKEKATTKSSIPDDIHIAIINDLFLNVESYRDKGFKASLPAILNKYNLPSGINAVREEIMHLKRSGLVKREIMGKTPIYKKRGLNQTGIVKQV